MFENATLGSGPAGKRVWTTFLGMTSQVFLVGSAVLAPMVFPQALPRTELLSSLEPPAPPGPPPKGKHVKQHAAVRAVPRTQFHGAILIAPVHPPDRAIMIDEPPGRADVVGVPGGDPRGLETGVQGAYFRDLAIAAVIPTLKRPVEPTAAPAAEPIKRFPQGGNVQLGRLLRKLEPPYPPLAKATRTSGTVVLECVVGTDGRIKDVRVVSGNPLLVNAARDAVWQWVYEGSQLNGVPIEIVAQISVNFKLN